MVNMSYLLGSITLLNPKRFSREFVETGVQNSLLDNISTKRTENRKERYILEYEHLTPAEVNSILSIFELNSVVNFTADDTNLNISVTPVLIDITNRKYPLSGELYRENLTLVLTEVK